MRLPGCATQRRRGRTVVAMTGPDDPLAQAQAQLRTDVELVRRYGEYQVPEHFGGCYFDNDPPVTIVALFTADLDRHKAILHARVAHPDRLIVQPTPRTWLQVEAYNRWIAERLMVNRREPGVHAVGIGLHEGRFVVEVAINPYTAELVARIAGLVQPREVVIRQGGPYRKLSHPAG